LVRLLPKAEARWPGLQARFGLERYVLVTLHRPSNVDDPATLKEIVTALREICKHTPVIFPVHPRTREHLIRLNLFDPKSKIENLKFLEPLGYVDFLALHAHAALVLTDSGGIQEETTYLGIPCLTARPNTERPVTVTHGTNKVIGGDSRKILSEALALLHNAPQPGCIPELWDGEAALRISESFQEYSIRMPCNPTGC